MIRANTASLILAAIVAVFGIAVAGQVTRPAVESPAGDLNEVLTVEETIALLEEEYDQWLEAVLGGSQTEAAQIEKNVFGIVNLDIMRNQEGVRIRAREIALASDQKSSSREDSVAAGGELKQAINHLNAKEAVFRSALKTDAFSNKYRLLGDYIDLLRRELEMPRLKYVLHEKSPESEAARPDASLPQDE